MFNMSAFKTSFEGPFKYQENPRAAWMRHDNSNPLVKVCHLEDPKFSNKTSINSMFLCKFGWFLKRKILPDK